MHLGVHYSERALYSLSFIINKRKFLLYKSIFHISLKIFFLLKLFDNFLCEYFSIHFFLCFNWTKKLITFQFENISSFRFSLSLHVFSFINANENKIWFVVENSFPFNSQMKIFCTRIPINREKKKSWKKSWTQFISQFRN